MNILDIVHQSGSKHHETNIQKLKLLVYSHLKSKCAWPNRKARFLALIFFTHFSGHRLQSPDCCNLIGYLHSHQLEGRVMVRALEQDIVTELQKKVQSITVLNIIREFRLKWWQVKMVGC